MNDGILLSAFLMGFLGSTHCIAMCSGIVGVLSQRGMPQLEEGGVRNIGFVLSYNAGRIVSYGCIGLLAGLLGSLGFSLIDRELALMFSRILTSLFMLSFSFYLWGLPNFLPFLEKKGLVIWALISPYTRRFLPIRSLKQSLFLGLIWGWLPCGLVYSAVVLSFSSTQALYGALTMLFFGLGTLPAMLFMGLASDKLNQLKGSEAMRRISGVVIFVLAGIHLFSIDLLGHAGH